MTTQEAIQLAVDGGYHTAHGRYLPASDIGKQVSNDDGFLQKCLLDPLFWQALGRGMGERRGWNGFYRSLDSSEWALYDLGKSGADEFVNDHWIPAWNWKWHRLIDHLAEGKSIEDFFANLLPHE